jgi:hypothetical protein
MYVLIYYVKITGKIFESHQECFAILACCFYSRDYQYFVSSVKNEIHNSSTDILCYVR